MFFFFNDTATTEIYTLSLHDALPISFGGNPISMAAVDVTLEVMQRENTPKRSAERGTQLRDALEEFKKRFDFIDRKSTRLNSSHGYISYAVFCLKKKNAGDDAQEPRI